MIYTRDEFIQKVEECVKNVDYKYNQDFVHTHVHTECSFLDGAGKIKDLAKKCAEINSPMVITDHGNVAATIRAYQECKKNNIPLIRGFEAYIRKNEEDGEEDYEGNYFHLIMLPYTKEGFENINLLSSLGYTQGIKYVAKRPVPVISKNWLEKHSSGIVAMSACMFGEVSANIWLHYPYLELLKRIKPKWAVQLIDIGRRMIDKKKVLTKKSGLTIDDLDDEDVLRMILQKKKLKKLKNILLNEVGKASNRDIVEIAKEEPGYIDRIVDVIEYYMGIFDFFYLEIQDHNFVEQKLTTLIKKHIVETNDMGTKLVVTNDVHYVKDTDWEVQDVLLCISTKKTMSDPTRFKFTEHELYFKSPEELKEKFSYLDDFEKDEYLKNSVEVAKICLNYEMKLEEVYYPKYDVPEGFADSGEYLLYQSVEGARKLAIYMPGDFRYRIFKIIEYPILREIVYETIDFKTSLEMVKDEKKQSLIIPMIRESISDSARKVLDISVKNKGVTISAAMYDRYLEAIDRVIYEFANIIIKEISDYFLITQQIIAFAKNKKILVGPGRGSCAGSSIAYLLGITEIDPLDYALLWERFINPERNSYPDIDSDLPQRHLRFIREETAKYFGIENCCGVNAFGNIQNKRAIQDSFRVYDFEAQEYTKVSKEISNDIEIKESICLNKEFERKYNENIDGEENLFKKAIDAANSITGNIRQAGTHAAGLIITPRELDMFKKLPVMLVGGRINSQYDKNDVEYAGFLKMDLLGIRTLDIIQDTVEYVKKYRGEEINIAAIDLSDAKTFELYQRADTSFVFQVESEGMKNFLRKLKPKNIEDIICVLSGYRPGPMAYLGEYIDVRNGKKEAVYRHPLLKPILEVTGGISFYQEQIIEIFTKLAGYSLGRADLVRRAMGKKKKEILDAERNNFVYGIQARDDNGELLFEEDGCTPLMEVNGCVKNGIPEEVAHQIYDDLVPFSSYGFNKSHSAGYAILSFRCAYLKANYFLEYATSVLRSVEGEKERLTDYAEQIKVTGVNVLFPDINKSSQHMDIYDFKNSVISTGLMAINGMPEEMGLNIIKEREENGHFKTYEEFLKRMSKYQLDKKSLTALVCSGALDCFDTNMEKMISYYEYFSGYIKARIEYEKSRQISIFDIGEFKEIICYLEYIPDNQGYDAQERLALLCEYNNVGIHPEVVGSYKAIKNNLRMSRRQDEDYETKEGTVSGILESEFALSKKGKAYLATMRTFTGEIYKIIATRKKIDIITDDINQYKKGMVVDVMGSFKFPKIVPSDDESSDDGAAYVNDEVIVFPNGFEIQRLEEGFKPLHVSINLDKRRYSEEIVEGYWGKSAKEVIVDLLSRKSECGKKVSITMDGLVFNNSNKFDITLDEIDKLGVEYCIK